jgi:hypothetical protein
MTNQNIFVQNYLNYIVQRLEECRAEIIKETDRFRTAQLTLRALPSTLNLDLSIVKTPGDALKRAVDTYYDVECRASEALRACVHTSSQIWMHSCPPFLLAYGEKEDFYLERRAAFSPLLTCDPAQKPFWCVETVSHDPRWINEPEQFETYEEARAYFDERIANTQ